MGAAAVPVIAGAGAYSAYAEQQAGKSAASYYTYLSSVSRQNANLAEKAADSQTKEIGAESLQQDTRIGERVRATVGAQQVAFASGGVGGTSKTAEQIVSDTLDKGNIDEIALRYNAALKTKAAQLGGAYSAMNERGQAAGYDIAGGNAVAASRLRATGTILGTAGSVANVWSRYRINDSGQFDRGAGY